VLLMATASVTSGEICTASAARQYGIYHPKNILQPTYNDTRTFSANVMNDQRRPKRLCTELSGDVATKICSVEHGYGFTAKNNDQCIAGTKCPPNFREDPSNPSRCEKQIIEKQVNKAARCDEKWYDWFTIENYHLGNKYQSVKGKCLKPCAPDQVPMYITDPVDGKAVNNPIFEDLSQCVSKDDYLNGKYSGESDFCPLAWIHRLGATQEEVKKSLNDKTGKRTSSNDPAFKSALENRLNTDAASVLQQCHNFLENVSTPSASMDLACSKASFQTPERVNEAYEICKGVLNNDSSLKTTWVSNGTNTEKESNTKMEVLKQACDKMFCYKNTNLPLLLRKPSICFKTRYQSTEAYNEGGATTSSRRNHVLTSNTGQVSEPTTGAVGGAVGGAGGSTLDTNIRKPHSNGDDFSREFVSKSKLYLKWLIVGFLCIFIFMICVKIFIICKNFQNPI